MEEHAESSGVERFFTVLLSAAASALLILGLLIASIEMFALNPSFFNSEYKKLNTASDIGIDPEDLTQVTNKLIDYIADKEDNLDILKRIQGEEQEVFGEREKAHMIDVKALYLAARNVRTISLIGAAVLAATAFVIGRKRTIKTLCKSFIWVSCGFLIAVGAISVWAASDFNNFWVTFHHIFFAGNDLWLLDPATDVLIQMVPEQFFSDLVARIIIRFISIFLALNLAAAAGLYIIRKKQRKKAEAQ